ncbi:hypothetical protein G3I15_27370, partial [Streptomyces sp. SID10244]|nr:hypothetical protein [Streptomyces sp. SID10244]
QRMWFINRFDPSSPAYNIPFALTLTGRLDVDALRAALADVITRHESMRTVFPADENGDAVQEILDPAILATDTSWWSRPTDIAAARDLARQPFDVTRDLPIRTALVATGDDDHLLVVIIHHIAADGESLAPLLRDIVTAYT